MNRGERRTATGAASHVGPSTVNYRGAAVPLRADLVSRIAPDQSPSPGEPRLPAPGERIGKYEIIRELGRGGFGAVFAGRDTKLGRRVAIKFLHGVPEPDDTERFFREARATAQAPHENIVIIYEVGEHDGRPFMVLEYLQGVPLSSLMRDGTRLPPAQVVEYVVQIVRALVAAHSFNIVHRDLKPANVIVTDAGVLKVLDFGIAKLMRGDDEALLARGTGARTAVTLDDLERGHTITLWNAFMGTVSYMSPEQWRGAGEVDHQTDIWAVGIIMFRMLTGRHPLGAPRNLEDYEITKRVDVPMPSIRAVCPDVPEELAAIVDGCLKKPKADRIVSAAELLRAIEPLLPGRERRLRADESPYAGLNAFQEEDAGKFFGRTGEVGTAIARLRVAPLLAIVGPSGVGKSSLVRAGIIPALNASGEAWSTLVVRPSRDPIDALAAALTTLLSDDAETTANTEVTALTASVELSQQQTMVKYLRTQPGYLGTMLRLRARGHGGRILVFIDQFEELYTQADPTTRAAFLAALAGVADDATSPLRVVLSIRSDFLDRIAEDRALFAELTRGLFFLGPPSRDGLREALIEPAAMAGYRWDEPALIEAVVDHLAHTPGALPLLSFAAAQLWELRDRARRLLTGDGYRRIGGITGALASHADAVVAECTPREQALVRAILLRLVTAERTRALVPVSELSELASDPSELDRVIERLMHARLVVGQILPSERGGTVARGSVELVHESLIDGWPLLRRWLDETAEDSAFLEQVRHTAKQWEARGYPQGLLWRGVEAAEAKLWRSRFRGELPELQRSYLDAVFALATKTARRKRGAVIAGMIVLALITSAATAGFIVVREAKITATAERNTATAERAKTIDANSKLESKNAALLTAVDAATKARNDSERARVEAERARYEADEARIRAEVAQRLEGRSKRRATAAAQAARTAEADARRASEELEIQLSKEQQRVKELEALTKGAAIVPEMKRPDEGSK